MWVTAAEALLFECGTAPLDLQHSGGYLSANFPRIWVTLLGFPKGGPSSSFRPEIGAKFGHLSSCALPLRCSGPVTWRAGLLPSKTELAFQESEK